MKLSLAKELESGRRSRDFGDGIGLLWAQYGPYHYARAAALKKLAGAENVHAIEMSNQTSWYEWKRSAVPVDLITLCPGVATEQLSFWQVFTSARRKFAELNLKVCILPSYWPRQSLAALLAAKSLGIRTVMMNEGHAGTARARGAAAWMKRRLVGLFDAALVGGLPQKRYIIEMGLRERKILTGYDAVDNDYFALKTEEIRSRRSELQKQYDLPEHYFLSLGRFLPKKNLATLIRSYHKLLVCKPNCQTHLVMVGSGEEEEKLRALCNELRLAIYDKTTVGTENQKLKSRDGLPGVHYYGFRQIEENPIFYALAGAFVMPSLWEEWGLVVNEAMACGLPVVASETIGCAEDLLRMGWPVATENLLRKSPHLAGRIRQNGFVFDPKSVESLAEALMALESAPQLCEIMGRNSRAIIDDFSCENFAANALLAARIARGEQPPLHVTQRPQCRQTVPNVGTSPEIETVQR